MIIVDGIIIYICIIVIIIIIIIIVIIIIIIESAKAVHMAIRRKYAVPMAVKGLKD
jgi:hypothetical protein